MWHTVERFDVGTEEIFLSLERWQLAVLAVMLAVLIGGPLGRCMAGPKYAAGTRPLAVT